MDEYVVRQRMEHAIIIPHKNYSRLSDKKEENNFWDVNRALASVVPFDGRSRKLNGRITNGKFFYNDTEDGIGMTLAVNYPQPKKTTFLTNKQRQISRHFINPFTEITLLYLDRSIKVVGDKVTIKQYRRTRYRDVNWKYFREWKHSKTLTVDLSTGNFTFVEYEKTPKVKPRKDFRKNSFTKLNEYTSKGQKLFMYNNKPEGNPQLLKEFDEVFNDDVFFGGLKTTLGIDISDSANFIRAFIKKFVELKKIKVPNDYHDLIHYFYPTEKFLKKNERKLVASVLDLFKIKSNVTVKMLHQCPTIDLISLSRLCGFLGEDYSKFLGNLKFDKFGRFNTKTPFSKQHLEEFGIGVPSQHIIRKIEKENLIKVLNNRNDDLIEVPVDTYQFLTQVFDHFNMIAKIRPYSPEVQFNAKTMSEFTLEHTEFSKIISAIRKGRVIEYIFDDELIEKMEEPIVTYIETFADEYSKDVIRNKHVHYPVLLKREEEYSEEGMFMHHCVGGYADKEKSIIVSLRTEDTSDRVTSEFAVSNGQCVQSRHFCNARPPEHFKQSLQILIERVNSLSYKDGLKYKEKKMVPVKINGIQIAVDVLPQVRMFANFA